MTTNSKLKKLPVTLAVINVVSTLCLLIAAKAVDVQVLLLTFALMAVVTILLFEFSEIAIIWFENERAQKKEAAGSNESAGKFVAIESYVFFKTTVIILVAKMAISKIVEVVSNLDVTGPEIESITTAPFLIALLPVTVISTAALLIMTVILFMSTKGTRTAGIAVMTLLGLLLFKFI